MSEPLIHVEHLTIGWEDFILQEDACFQVMRGDIFVILGGSGCGNSTTSAAAAAASRPCSVT
jgi:phospholipid/cholesterol/gamma-HCH transport system ATP-binding protein